MKTMSHPFVKSLLMFSTSFGQRLIIVIISTKVAVFACSLWFPDLVFFCLISLYQLRQTWPCYLDSFSPRCFLFNVASTFATFRKLCLRMMPPAAFFISLLILNVRQDDNTTHNWDKQTMEGVHKLACNTDNTAEKCCLFHSCPDPMYQWEKGGLLHRQVCML